MVRSLDVDVNSFINELDVNLAASRSVFSHFDSVMHVMSDADWDKIQLKVNFTTHPLPPFPVIYFVLCYDLRNT